MRIQDTILPDSPLVKSPPDRLPQLKYTTVLNIGEQYAQAFKRSLQSAPKK